MFQVLKHVFQSVGHMFQVAKHIFQAVEHKITNYRKTNLFQ